MYKQVRPLLYPKSIEPRSFFPSEPRSVLAEIALRPRPQRLRLATQRRQAPDPANHTRAEELQGCQGAGSGAVGSRAEGSRAELGDG